MTKAKAKKLVMQTVPVILGTVATGLIFAYGNKLPFLVNARRGFDDQNAR